MGNTQHLTCSQPEVVYAAFTVNATEEPLRYSVMTVTSSHYPISVTLVKGIKTTVFKFFLNFLKLYQKIDAFNVTLRHTRNQHYHFFNVMLVTSLTSVTLVKGIRTTGS